MSQYKNYIKGQADDEFKFSTPW